MLGLAHRGFRLNDYRRHLAQFLPASGYSTTLIGAQHESSPTVDVGYGEVVPVEQKPRGAAQVAPVVEDFLRARRAREPFFLSVGFWNTHRPFPEPTPEDDPRLCRPFPGLPDAPETREDMAAFLASCRLLDGGVGRVLAALEGAGLAENTLVILTTDHGPAFPGIKCTLTDGGTGVMLVMRGPGGFSGGRVVDGLVSHIDVFPTLCEVCGIAAPAWLQGRSMMPLLRGEAQEINEAVFSEVTYHAAYEPQRAVRTKRWKYIRRFDGRTRPVLPNIDDGPSKTLMLRLGLADRPPAEEALFDVAFDPNEACNLARDPAAAGVLAEMRSRLEAWMRATNDPILRGLPVPAPKGAKVNLPDQLSPNDPTTTV
jgi:N-sulfoglucosamine sulfohydrolase